MNKSILCALVLIGVTTWGYAQETQSLTVQPTTAPTPDSSMTTQPTAQPVVTAESIAAAAEQGNAQAECTLGLMYLYGKGEPQDYQQSMKWLQSSSSQGNGKASYSIGYLYASGKGVTEDDQAALQWFQKALAQGYAKAQASIDILNQKMGQPQNPSATAEATPSNQNPAAPASSTATASPWYLSIGAGIDIPAQNWIPAYTLGSGGALVLGYQLAKDWAVELSLNSFGFSGTSALTGSVSDDELRILPTARYTISTGSDIQPYVLAGLGIDVQFLGGPSGSELVTSFDIAAGLGVECKMDSKLYLFVECKLNLLMANGPNNNTVTGQDIPALAGVRLGL